MKSVKNHLKHMAPGRCNDLLFLSALYSNPPLEKNKNKYQNEKSNSSLPWNW